MTMERFPRGTLPPKAFAAVATLAPTAIARPDVAPPVAIVDPAHRGVDPARDLDLSTTCPNCAAEMLPEHAHYKCPGCGYRDSSSF